MSEPMWLQGDPATFSNATDNMREIECGNSECLLPSDVEVTEDYTHGEVTWYAEWVCNKCEYENTSEGWYEPYDE